MAVTIETINKLGRIHPMEIGILFLAGYLFFLYRVNRILQLN